MPQSRQRVRLMTMLTKHGFTREERLELAEMLLKRDVLSFTHLSEEEIGRLVDAVEGHALIHYLLTLRVSA